MFDWLELYCHKKGYNIIDNGIYKNDTQIGTIHFKDKFIQVGNSRFKPGDFALLLMEDFDILGEE